MGERLSLSDRCSPLFASRAEGKLIHGRWHLNTGRGEYRARADHHGPQTHECCNLRLCWCRSSSAQRIDRGGSSRALPPAIYPRITVSLPARAEQSMLPPSTVDTAYQECYFGALARSSTSWEKAV